MLHRGIDPPDVVKGLSLVHYYAACGTPVAVEEVFHDAALTDWKKTKYITVSNTGRTSCEWHSQTNVDIPLLWNNNN